MSLLIDSIMDRGVPNMERVVLKATADVDLAFYAVIESATIAPEKIQAGAVDAYWFAAQPVRSGDVVILFTGSGKPNSATPPNQTATFHFVYWGRKKTIFGPPNTTAVLLQLAGWTKAP